MLNFNCGNGLGARKLGPLVSVLAVIIILVAVAESEMAASADDGYQSGDLRRSLDAPMLFVKRHAYMSPHIYDDYLVYRPGGGIYLLENPADDPAKYRIRPIIDPTTEETLGEGVYRDPTLSWDAMRIVFAFKGSSTGATCLYEIGIDGRGLRQLTNPDCDCVEKNLATYGSNHHDVTPSFLPDGRIVFTSTRNRALVPCFNSGVDTLHVLNPATEEVRPISVNNVNEFDPSVLHDGRILYGRWEYVDKTALYMQSLWTTTPDGRMEEAFFANNLAKPTAVLDARPVPGSRLVCVSLTPHNGQAVGAIAMIDPLGGKNDLSAVTNFTPEYPTEMDQGLKYGPSDPWPLDQNRILIANNASKRGEIQIIDRFGHRETLLKMSDIDCYSPMLVKPRPVPGGIAKHVDESERTGRFLVVDVTRGLSGVERGEARWLRVVEECARVSTLPPGGRWWNQAFLTSWQGAYGMKNILGVVPIEEDGSVHFEAPCGRALYFELLDGEGLEIQRMRTFVQAAPGATRSCVGCHEDKKTTPRGRDAFPIAASKPPQKLRDEAWGSGHVDFPSMIQPILDRRCVKCHGGEKGMGAGLDFSGGWTWAFSISYETMIKHQMVGYLNCNNGSVHTSEVLPPRTIGSGGSSLARRILDHHPEMTPAEKSMIFAWMDTNSNFHGTWDHSPYATSDAALKVAGPLTRVMQQAGCIECHAGGHIGNDWVNLQRPEWSRILRAPMAKSARGGLGLEFCRERKAISGYPLVNQGQQPPDIVRSTKQFEYDFEGEPHIVFQSTDDPNYKEMLSIIRAARQAALARPRIDMPGPEIYPGESRMNVPPALPAACPPVEAMLVGESGKVELRWPMSARTVGLEFSIHKGDTSDFVPTPSNLIAETPAGRWIDATPKYGAENHYALVARSLCGDGTVGPTYASVEVPPLPPPVTPCDLTARSLPGQVEISWSCDSPRPVLYHVYRQVLSGEESQPADPSLGSVPGGFARVTASPVADLRYLDSPPIVDRDNPTARKYVVQSVDAYSVIASDFSSPVSAAPSRTIVEPVVLIDFDSSSDARVHGEDSPLSGKLRGNAVIEDGKLKLSSAGHLEFARHPLMVPGVPFTVTCRVKLQKSEATMPVVLASGQYSKDGWFLQLFGGRWRWHVSGTSCDGGAAVWDDWTRLVLTFDGRRLSVYQDGRRVAQADRNLPAIPYGGPLIVGQYSSVGSNYQVRGEIDDVAIYARVLSEAEIKTLQK